MPAVGYSKREPGERSALHPSARTSQKRKVSFTIATARRSITTMLTFVRMKHSHHRRHHLATISRMVMAMMTGRSQQQQQQEDANDEGDGFGELCRMDENGRTRHSITTIASVTTRICRHRHHHLAPTSMMMMAMSTTSCCHRGNRHDGAAGHPILTHSPKFSKVVVRTGTVVVVVVSSSSSTQ